MLLLLALADTVARSGAPAPLVQARATVRIERVISAATEWKSVPPEARREIIRKRPDGQNEKLRLIDYP